MVINCCGLEYDTYEEISERGKRSESIQMSEVLHPSKDEEIESNDNINTYKIYV